MIAQIKKNLFYSWIKIVAKCKDLNKKWELRDLDKKK